MEPTNSKSSYEKVQDKKEEIAKRIASKTPALKAIARKYKPKKQEAECDLARDVFYETLSCYEKGECTWGGFVSELSKSLQAIKSAK